MLQASYSIMIKKGILIVNGDDDDDDFCSHFPTDPTRPSNGSGQILRMHMNCSKKRTHFRSSLHIHRDQCCNSMGGPMTCLLNSKLQ